MITSFINRYSLSEIAQNLLLEMILILLPSTNKLPKTITKLWKLFENEKTVVSESRFCQTCQKNLEENCNCTINANNSLQKYDSYVQVSIERQIKTII